MIKICSIIKNFFEDKNCFLGFFFLGCTMRLLITGQLIAKGMVIDDFRIYIIATITLLFGLEVIIKTAIINPLKIIPFKILIKLLVFSGIPLLLVINIFIFFISKYSLCKFNSFVSFLVFVILFPLVETFLFINYTKQIEQHLKDNN